MAIGTLHYAEATVYKAQKALVAAKFTGLTLDEKKFDASKDGRKPDFLAKNPTGKVPYLETDEGCVATSNAVAKYIVRCRADSALYGNCFDDEGSVDTWLEFCLHEIEAPLMVWVYPVLGLMAEAPAAVLLQAQGDLKKALAEVEKQLQASAFLVGDAVSLADIAVVCALREGFERVLDAAFRKAYPKTMAWFEKCCAMTQFKSVFGEVKLCDKAQAAKPFAPPAARGADKKEAKKDEKKAEPKKEEKKAAPKAAPAAAPAAAVSAADEAAIKAIGDELRALKEKLKAEGVSGKKINDNAEIKALVDKLTAAKAGATAAPEAAPAKAAPAKAAAAPAAAAGGGDATAIGEELRALKEKLKGEGLTGKKLNDHPDIKALVEKLAAAKAGGGAAPAAPPAVKSPKSASPKAAPKAASPKAAPKASPKGGASADDEAKAVGDELRVLKEKLKGEGITGKKLNAHPEVSALVEKLSALKAKM